FDLPERVGPAFVPEKEGAAGDVPALRFPVLKKGVLSKLPRPPAAFGLDLRAGSITDAEMKALARFQNLQALSLYETENSVTAAGLKELAWLSNLRSLDLGKSAITDAALKDLAGLKDLR